MVRITAALVVLMLTACTAELTSTLGEELRSSDSPSFDLAAVQASFTEECESPIVVDELFCEQVEIAGMQAEGSILTVPTTLNAEATDRAQAICEQLAAAHFDGDGADLGYSTIGILDRDGGNAAACTVAP